MARSGDVISSPVIGETITFEQTAKDTDGALLRFAVVQRPGAKGPAMHLHARQEERLAVVSGTMRVLLGERELELRDGEEVVVPPGVPHRWWNGGAGPLRAVNEFRPALQMERFFETIYGLARDGKTDADGVPPLLQLALLTEYEIFLPKPPVPVQRVVLGLLAPVARLRGYRARYPAYSRDEV